MSRQLVWRDRWIIESHPEKGPKSAKEALDEILDQLRAHGWVQHDVFSVHLAVEEALINAIKHGNNYDATKSVRLLCRLRSNWCQIKIADEGPGFDPATVPDCTLDENLDTQSGRGLMLMRGFMTTVVYVPPGKLVVMEKVRTPCSQAAA